MFSRLRDVVWVSVLAIAFGAISLVAAIAGADTRIVVASGAFGIILASMAPRA